MKYNKEELTKLVGNPQKFKREVVKSMGYALHKAYAEGIEVPLSLLQSREFVTELSIILSKKNEHLYPSKEFADYWKTVNSMKGSSVKYVNNRGTLILKEKTVEIDKLLASQPKNNDDNLKIEDLEPDISKISTVKQYFEYIELVAKKDKHASIYENMIDKVSLNVFNRENVEEFFEKIIKNTSIKESILGDKHYFQSSHFFKVVAKVIDNANYEDIPEDLIEVSSLVNIYEYISKSDNRGEIIREFMLVKARNNPKSMFIGLSIDDINFLKTANWDMNNEEESKIIWSLLEYVEKNTYSAGNFRPLVLNSFINDLISIEKVEDKFPSALKSVKNLRKGSLWGDEMISILEKKVAKNPNKYWGVSNFYSWMSEGRTYSDKFEESVEIPREFFDKIYPILKDNWRTNFYISHSEYYESQLNIMLQFFLYQQDKRLEDFVTGDITKEQAMHNLEEMLSFMSSIGHKDSCFRNSNLIKNANLFKMAIESEIKVYDYIKLVVDKYEDNLSYEEAMSFALNSKRTVKELTYSTTSALVQNSKNPSSLWTLMEVSNTSNSYGYHYTNVKFTDLEKAGISTELMFKPLLEMAGSERPQIEKNIEELRSADGYQVQRANVLETGSNVAFVFNMISNLVNREHVGDMSDLDYSKHLNAIEHFASLNFIYSDEFKNAVSDKLKNARESLKDISDELPNNYFFSLDYLLNNFEKDLVMNSIKHDKDVLNNLLDKYEDKITPDMIKQLIGYSYDAFHKLGYDKIINAEDTISSTKEIIKHFVLKNHSDYEDVKESLVSGPDSEIYQPVFIQNKESIIQELLSVTDIESVGKYTSLLSLDDLKENFHLFLKSENSVLIQSLLKTMPGKRFSELFNECEYKYQRVVLSIEDVFSVTRVKEHSMDNYYKFNPKTLDEFIEIFEKLNYEKRLGIINNKDLKEKSFLSVLKEWEGCKALKSINVPNNDEVVKYLVDNLPLSFLRSFELDLKTNYAGELPRELTTQEFLQVYLESYEKYGGSINILSDVNDKIDIYSSFFKAYSNKNSNIQKDLAVSEINLSKYLDALEHLKKTPALYYEMILSTSEVISNIIQSVTGLSEESDKKTSKVIWKDVSNYPILNEIKTVLDMKFGILDKINEREGKYIGREEFFQHFASVFLDKNIYMEGWRIQKDKMMTDSDASNKMFENYHNNHLDFFIYYYYNPNGSDVYNSTYSGSEDTLLNISKEIVENDPSMFFDRYYPMFKLTLSEESAKYSEENNVSQRMLADEVYTELYHKTYQTMVQKIITPENVWPILLSSNLNRRPYAQIKEDAKEVILDEILNIENNKVEVLKELAQCIEFVQFVNNMNLSYNINQSHFLGSAIKNSTFDYLEDMDLKKIQILVESMIMEQELLNMPSITDRPKNMAKKF